MKIAIGSTNPVKINAVKNVMKKIFEEVEVVSGDVETGVSHTPLNDEETIKGAINRAREALKKTGADLGVGMEGGINKVMERYFLSGWCAIVDKNNNVSLGGGSTLELPNHVIQGVLEGKELGNVMDELTGIENTKQKMGAIGIFTNDLMNRQEAWETFVTYAMSRKLKPELYK